MEWLYQMLGFKKLKVIEIDNKLSAIEHQDNDDFEVESSVLDKINPEIRKRGYLWLK